MNADVAFLISQPRAGSTMVQQILSGHPEIGTTEEPWLLLPLLFPYESTCSARYGAHIANTGNSRFFERFSENSHGDLRARCARAFAEEAYTAANVALGTSLFLDKTPRYYLIIDEILQAFPEAKLILLVRNPCAIFTSIVTSWVGNILLKLRRFKVDFLDGPEAIRSARRKKDPRILEVRYEDFLAQPEAEIRRMLLHLGVPYCSSLEQYGDRDISEYRLGDHKSVYRLGNPDPGRAERWVQDLKDPQVWRLTRDYLRWLEDRDLVSSLGYDLASCQQQLERMRPSLWALYTTIPLSWLLGDGAPVVRTVRDCIIRLRCKCVALCKRAERGPAC